MSVRSLRFRAPAPESDQPEYRTIAGTDSFVAGRIVGRVGLDVILLSPAV